MQPTFELTKEEKDELTNTIHDYVQREHSEHFGNMEAMLLLDFFMENIAPIFYNKGVQDSHMYITDKLDDLFEIEKRISK
ncbi:MAG TPA: DUF2164 domain-containing protein [Virgibacillus sp.]|nr:DUF2164 domain-containing protein [Virgibacillus sp.]